MATDFISLFAAALIAALSPIIARLVPRGLVPETVILLLAGALLGPYMAGVIQTTDSIEMLADLGLAFLFLLAGYEINPRSLSGSQGKKGLATWAVSIFMAFAAVALATELAPTSTEGIAVAIALTTTALGTLMPILKERQLEGTTVGDAILSFGTWGELCPVIAMALLLSSRSEWKTIVILLGFIALCIIMAVIPAKARRAGHRVYRFLARKRNTTSQTFVRVVVVLLIGLVTVSAVFGLDIVLGAFAAGFVLRYVIPEGDHELESKLDAIGYGFLIPVFFVVSGAKINLAGVGEQPLLLIAFIAALLVIRTLPIIVALSLGKDRQLLSIHNRVTVALYCTTALPIIVAVTSVAVKSGAMSQELAGVLVAAGAITVFLMPLLASLTYRVVDVHPVEAAHEIAAHPHDARTILHEHLELGRMLAMQEIAARHAAREAAATHQDPSWEDLAFTLQRESERKRALEQAIDFARQQAAAKKNTRNHFSEEEDASEGLSVVDIAKETDAIRRHIATRAVREYHHRMEELGRAAEHAIKKDDSEQEK